MSCRMPNCDKPTGMQDRDDYQDHRYCSVACMVKYEHLEADARDAMLDDRNPDEEL